DRFGLAPFLLFAAAPLVFCGARQRRILLGTFLAIGAYLGLTALCEGIGLHALVFPKYIVDPAYGFHAGRARGPFGESAVNGVALYFAGVAAVLAFVTMRRTWVRRLSLAVAALCFLGLIFTLQRSIWLGAIVATVVACAAAPALRRYLVPILAGG